MKRSLLPILIAFFCIAAASEEQVRNTPKSLVDRYVTMALKGELLTDNGWREASKLFLHPSTRPANNTIVVVWDKGTVDENWVKDDQAEETVSGYDVIGGIDSRFQFAREPKSPYYETEVVYHLVLTGAGEEASGSVASVKSEREWKIENPAGRRWTTLTAAIRYLTNERSKVSDPRTRKHVDDTLSILKDLRTL